MSKKEKICPKQVFWFTDHPNSRAFPPEFLAVAFFAAFVPDHSGGTTTELHRLPQRPSQALQTKAHLSYTIYQPELDACQEKIDKK